MHHHHLISMWGSRWDLSYFCLSCLKFHDFNDLIERIQDSKLRTRASHSHVQMKLVQGGALLDLIQPLESIRSCFMRWERLWSLQIWGCSLESKLLRRIGTWAIMAPPAEHSSCSPREWEVSCHWMLSRLQCWMTTYAPSESRRTHGGLALSAGPF